MKQKILILGGDGFCGWPTALHLSNAGHEICILDNLSRRRIDDELGVQSLTPIADIGERLDAWHALTGKTITFEHIDVARDFAALLSKITCWRPDAIIHFAEQRSAPYSMRNAACKRYTVENNLPATHNVLCAIVESGLDIHLVHLGSMGVYGYESANLTIPEGYIHADLRDGEGNCCSREIPYPPSPGSIYHMTKTQDALFFQFYNKNNGLRITDLHQGVVWGTSTRETGLAPGLLNRFDYDGDYGTVLNRFLVQSVLGHPLTVYGTGGQTRAFIHLQNTVECIRLAVENPPQKGDRVRIFNQAAEMHNVLELARIVAEISGAEIRHYANPRKEAAQNSLAADTSGLQKLGLKKITLHDTLLKDIREIVEKYKSRCDPGKIIATSMWTSEQKIDSTGSPSLPKC